MKQWAREQDEWLLVEQDECWFSRFAQPALHAFAEAGANLRLVERTPETGAADQALACYGARCQQTQARYFYLAGGQPNSEKTLALVQSLLEVAKGQAKRVLVVLWDRASWHTSHKVERWVRQYNRQAKKQADGVRLLTYLLPSKSPWLNSMEPIWLHAKRKVAEPDGALTVKVLKERLCAHFQTTVAAATLNVSG